MGAEQRFVNALEHPQEAWRNDPVKGGGKKDVNLQYSKSGYAPTKPGFTHGNSISPNTYKNALRLLRRDRKLFCE